MTIQIDNEYEKPITIDYDTIIRSVADAALNYEQCPYEAEVSVLLTGNDEIAIMNAEFRGIDRPTDVLSFPMSDYPVPADFSVFDSDEYSDAFNPETGELYSDEAEAAAEEAAEAAKAAGFTEAQKNETFVVPMSGTVMPVSEVDDQVFASKAMGDGIAIDPAEGKVYAPFSGEITVAFPTGHAYGLKAANGKEVLIHIGMDTVELDGKGFTPHVKQGDIVKQGDLLTEVDLDYIRSQGKPVVTHVSWEYGEHWIALIGYQNVTDPDHLTLDNFIALNPSDGAQIVASSGYALYGDGCQHVSER